MNGWLNGWLDGWIVFLLLIVNWCCIYSFVFYCYHGQGTTDKKIASRLSLAF